MSGKFTRVFRVTGLDPAGAEESRTVRAEYTAEEFPEAMTPKERRAAASVPGYIPLTYEGRLIGRVRLEGLRFPGREGNVPAQTVASRMEGWSCFYPNDMPEPEEPWHGGVACPVTR